uniref:Ig-like domain-containing protein n=1 Tax=Equus caballus TaxID=9796 RepID=F7C7Z3_HORSE
SQEVEQSPQSLIIQEGENVTINCSFSKTLYALHWYWQKHGEGPIFLMMLMKDGDEKSHDRIAAILNEKNQQSSLFITASQCSHSGTYFCGVEAQ